MPLPLSVNMTQNKCFISDFEEIVRNSQGIIPPAPLFQILRTLFVDALRWICGFFITILCIINTAKGLHVIHLKIRSLPSKIDLLRAWLVYNKPNIITLSETWLNNNISDNEIKLENYVAYRADRGAIGGGVATYVSSNCLQSLYQKRTQCILNASLLK